MSFSDSLPDPDSQPISASLPQPGDESVSSNPIDYDTLTNQVSHTDNPDYPGDSTSPSLTQDQVSQIANDQVKNSPNLSQAIGQAGTNLGNYAPDIATLLVAPELEGLPLWKAMLASGAARGSGKVAGNAITPGNTLGQGFGAQAAIGAIVPPIARIPGAAIDYGMGRMAASQVPEEITSLSNSLANNVKAAANTGKPTVWSSIINRIPGMASPEMETTAQQPVRDYLTGMANKFGNQAIKDPSNSYAQMEENMLNHLSTQSPENIMGSSDLSDLQGPNGLQGKVAGLKDYLKNDYGTLKGQDIPTNVALQSLLDKLSPEISAAKNKGMEKAKGAAQSVGDTAKTVGKTYKTVKSLLPD